MSVRAHRFIRPAALTLLLGLSGCVVPVADYYGSPYYTQPGYVVQQPYPMAPGYVAQPGYAPPAGYVASPPGAPSYPPPPDGGPHEGEAPQPPGY